MPKGIAVFKQTHKDQRPLWKILTFTFTMDAFPGRTLFNPKQVLCVIQILDDATTADAMGTSVMLHDEAEDFKEDGDKDSLDPGV